MIQVERLSKEYGSHLAVDDLSFSIAQGEIVGFLGPNGAGKTTTMHMLTGYISSTRGSILVNGTDLLEDPHTVKRQIGYLPEQPPLYGNMMVEKYLEFVCQLKRIRKDERAAQILSVCEKTGIQEVRPRLIDNLSKGYRQRVGLAQALLSNPPILILDEPTVGLDPTQIIEIRSLIRDLGREHTVLLSSHILSEIQAVCDRVLILHNGKLLADDAKESLSNSIQQDAPFSLRVAGSKEEALRVLKEVEGVARVLPQEEREPNSFDFELFPCQGEDPRLSLFAALSRAGLPILALQKNAVTLEEVFLRIVSGEEPAFSKEECTEPIVTDDQGSTDGIELEYGSSGLEVAAPPADPSSGQDNQSGAIPADDLPDEQKASEIQEQERVQPTQGGDL